MAQDASSATNVTLYAGVDFADSSATAEVVVGHSVKWVYLEFHFSPEVISNPKVIHWTVDITYTGMTTGAPNTYFGPDRSFILQRGMEMLPKSLSTVYKRIILVRIPRIYQRVKQNQLLRFNYISTSTETINACGISIFKEIY